MRPTLQDALSEARDLPAEELPRLLGDLEEVRATAQARLLAPPSQTAPDEWLDIKQAGALLKVSEDYLYHNHARYPFTRRMGKRLLFSRSGIEKHMKAAKAA
jgi:hypothetical protein